MDEKDDITQLKQEKKLLQKELENQKSNYKRLSTELGQSIFENEDLDRTNRELKNENENLKEEIKELKEEIEELKKFKEKIESSTTWKVKSIFK